MPLKLKPLYDKIVGINDTPHKIAAGLGLGIFLGIFPGLGPVSAVVLATLLRINKATALIGCLLTNTWISAVTFVLAAKIGAGILHLSWQELYNQTKGILQDFHFPDMFNVALFKIAWPLLVGYTVIGLVLAAVAYGLTFLVVVYRRKN